MDGAWLNLRELKGRAREQLPETAFDYVAGGSGDERTLEANRTGYRSWQLRHRVLTDVADRSTETTVLGEPVSMPCLVAPTAFHGLMHEDAEPATARGTAEAGTVFCASTLSNRRLEEIADAGDGPRWFQVYVTRTRGITERLVERADRAGYEALVLTVDTPVLGRRERDVRNGFTLPEGLTLGNFADLPLETLPDPGEGGSGLGELVEQELDPSLTWEDVAWLKGLADLPVLVKGVVTAEDARLAVDHGCDGIIVSNHGGRQLDAGVPTIRALPDVVEAVDGEAEVYVDGGVRRGTDVLVALALGARAVLVGRPVLWALALDGAAGVTRALEMLGEELDRAMALSGVRRVEEVTEELLVRA